MTSGEYAVDLDHQTVCATKWDDAMAQINNDNEYTQNCTSSLRLVDFNQDSYLNFREFIVIAGLITHPDIETVKWLNLNCSDCVGMDNYNPMHES